MTHQSILAAANVIEVIESSGEITTARVCRLTREAVAIMGRDVSAIHVFAAVCNRFGLRI